MIEMTVQIDEAALAAAQELLLTKTPSDTINAALKDVVTCWQMAAELVDDPRIIGLGRDIGKGRAGE